MKDVYNIKSCIKKGTNRHPVKITDDEITITFLGSWRKQIRVTRDGIYILRFDVVIIPFSDKVMLRNIKILKNTFGWYDFVGSKGWNLCKMDDLVKALEICLPNYFAKRDT